MVTLWQWLQMMLALLFANLFLVGCATSLYSEKSVSEEGYPIITKSSNFVFSPPGTKHVGEQALSVSVTGPEQYQITHGQAGEAANTLDQAVFNAATALGLGAINAGGLDVLQNIQQSRYQAQAAGASGGGDTGAGIGALLNDPQFEALIRGIVRGALEDALGGPVGP